MSIQETTAFVLAGGNSTRMGRDKALLQLKSGETLIEHTIGVCASVASEVKIVGPRERYASLAWTAEFVHDEFEGCGPLAGIHAALRNTATELNLVVAVDMPNLRPELLAYLLRKASTSKALAVVPRVNGREQPLCAVYRREFLPVAEESLKSGRYKIGALFRPEVAQIVDEKELAEHDLAADLFSNTNTPEEWQQAFGSR